MARRRSRRFAENYSLLVNGRPRMCEACSGETPLVCHVPRENCVAAGPTATALSDPYVKIPTFILAKVRTRNSQLSIRLTINEDENIKAACAVND